ncbi:MAG: DUF6106 family protein [Lachnospiraceae bacterium]|nr:DUF6106 family protein [Lachnospiraceae bacterium]
MAEAYRELLILRKENIRDKVLGITMVVLAAVSAIGAFFNLFSLIGIPVFGILSYVVYFRKMTVEYEYVYMDKELRIDRIYNQSKRKRVDTLDLNKMEILAKADSNLLDSYSNRSVEVSDYSTNSEDTEELATYEMYYDGKRKLILSLDRQMIDMMKTTLSYKMKGC